MKFVCKKTCFFNNRLFKPGEIFEGESANKHFEAKAPVVAKEVKHEVKDKKEAKKAAKPVDASILE